MSDNLPAVRPEAAVVARDTDSWTAVVGDIAKLANHIYETEFVPKGLRGSAAATAAAILYGREIGMGPMSSLAGIAVVNGRPTVMSEQLRAMVFAAGHEIAYDEMSGARVVVRGRRAGSEQWTKVEWTIDMARAAGLTGKDVWKNYPRAMLVARATAELCRLVFPDVTHGLHAVEEMDEGEAAAVAGEPAPAARSKVQRKQRPTTDDGAVTGSLKPSPPDAPSSPPLPPLPGEPGYDSVDGSPEQQGSSSARGTALIAGSDSDGILPLAGAEAPAAQSAAADNRVHASAAAEGGDEARGASSSPEVKMNTRAQQRGLFALFKGLGIADDAERLQVTADLIGRMPMEKGEPSWNGLTWDEASHLTTMMSAVKTRDQVEALIELAEQQRAAET